jgi:hypothetical protein
VDTKFRFTELNPQFCIQAVVTFVVLGFCIFQLSKDKQVDDKSNYFLLLGTVISYWFSPPSATKKASADGEMRTTTTNVVTPHQIQTQTVTQASDDNISEVEYAITQPDLYHARAIAPPDERY